MIRLIGSVFVHGNIALQTRNFDSYSPLGDLKGILDIYDKHCVDEIFISARLDDINSGPSSYVLNILTRANITTPVTYSGGITTVEHVRQCLESGVERVGLHSLLFEKPLLMNVIQYIGVQGVIAVLPFIKKNGEFFVFNCRTRKISVSISEIIASLPEAVELLLIDIKADGSEAGFSWDVIKKCGNRKVILQGGVVGEVKERMGKGTILDELSGVVIENRLLWTEYATQNYKKNIPIFTRR
jgi:imidazole glycerol-phosphate synthase subunit HisF